VELTLNLLGALNRTSPKTSPLKPKYVVKVTAAQIAQWLQYERKGAKKSDPFRIKPGSLIKIDPKIQRGTSEVGNYLSQQPSKIREISTILLGKGDSTPRIYLGALVWNVRPPGSFEVEEVRLQDKPSEYRLRMTTDAIYLTDSAHRHFGIAEAYAAWAAAPGEFPEFRADFEFLVEIYNLESRGETELFNELNAKQKKISAAKQKELDVSSPIGALKDAIIAYDQQNRGLLSNNIEVTGNVNKTHTLLTMSAFVASIAEMFGTAEIKAAWKDEELLTDLATYYCEFLYELSDKLVVQLSVDDGPEQLVHPYRNLYQDVIAKAVNDWNEASPDESQKRIDDAVALASDVNQRLRSADIANSNATVKALFRLGGLIGEMREWRTVIESLQMSLVGGAQGKFFQKQNADLFAKSGPTDVPIASINENGSLNVQVQTKTINKLASYLRAKLDLDLDPIVTVRGGDSPSPLLEGAPQHWALVTGTDNFRTIELRVVVPAEIEISSENTSLRVTPTPDWKEAKLKLDPTSIVEDRSYAHPTYSEFKRWTVSFEVRLSAVDKMKPETELKLSFNYPELNGAEEKTERKVRLSRT
jgi:hypothetical protein